MKKIFIIGTGLWGCVFGERISSEYKCKITAIESAPYVGGACYSVRDADSGIECHMHGTHIFHTAIKSVWEYINQFSDFTRYRHKVLIRHANHVYTMPINLGTINDFYGSNHNPVEALNFISSEIARHAIPNPKNLEDKAISLIGRPLYETFIKGYTQKQWGCDPRDLPADIITRLPVRFNYNSEYFNDYWQGMPRDGYSTMFSNLIKSPHISVQYNTDFFSVREQLPKDSLIVYTGLPDKLFGYKYGELEWRSLRFEWEHFNIKDFQGTSVMNYADTEIPFTRIHEFKHLHPERSKTFHCSKTIICREYPQKWEQGDSAYYPVNNKENNERYELYRQEADKAGIILGGRLGKYKYFDMDKCIDDALKTFENELPRFLQ